MRVHVALTPAEFPGLELETQAAVVVDVIRATTTVVAACAAGCRRVIPAVSAAAARARSADFPGEETLLAGEQGGEPIGGFDLGNSPLEYTADRVRGRTIIFTTTNGTGAMVAAGRAVAAAVAALTNVDTVARWAAAHGRDLTVLCAGERGGFSLEDAVCAGFLVDGMASSGTPLEVSDAAVAARRLAEHYAPRLHQLLDDSRWARRLSQAGRAADLDACLRLGTVTQVPVFETGAIVPGPPALTWLNATTQTERDRRTAPEPTR